jgi:hypothetical protein
MHLKDHIANMIPLRLSRVNCETKVVNAFDLSDLHQPPTKKTKTQYFAPITTVLLEMQLGKSSLHKLVTTEFCPTFIDGQGLPLQFAAELETMIHPKFCQGTNRLAHKDYHFI